MSKERIEKTQATEHSKLKLACEEYESVWCPDLRKFGDFLGTNCQGQPAKFCKQLAYRLIRVDLEHRYADSKRPEEVGTIDEEAEVDTFDLRSEHVGTRLESYLPYCACLDSADEFPADLIAIEIRLRSEAGEALAPGEFKTRFPKQWESIKDSDGFKATRGSTSDSFSNPSARSSLGKFKIEYSVGEGGFGTVYKARDTELNRDVAIKLPRYGGFRSEQERERFSREASAAAKLRHQHICPIYEVGVHEGQTYIALAYVEGETLREAAKKSDFGNRKAIETIAKIARAVHFAHEAGVIHRDIKPDNIMLDGGTGEPLLMDFGLAKEVQKDEDRLTITGAVMGTAAFMPPEQASGAISEVGPLSDVYSLGATLFSLLADRPPYIGSAGEIIAKVQTQESPPLRKFAPQLHRDLDTICGKAMAKKPEHRYESAAALATDLERFLDGESILAKRESLPSRFVRLLKKHPLASSALLLSLVLLVAGGFFTWRGISQFTEGQLKNRESELRSQINANIEADAWTAAELARVDAAIAELETITELRAAESRTRVNRRFGEFVLGQIQKPSLSDEQIDRIEAWISQLEKRDPTEAARLQDRLAQRTARWESLFSLSPPFNNLSVFPDSSVEVRGTQLTRTSTDESNTPLLTNAVAGRRIEFESTFAPDWTSTKPFGLRVNHYGNDYGYSFRVKQADSPDDYHWLAEIVRRDVVLQADQLPDELINAKELRLRARRVGSRLTLWVNESFKIETDDVFPVYEPGVLGIECPSGTAIVTASARQQIAAIETSPLELADQLYGNGELEAARTAYSEQLTESIDRQLWNELKYKESLCLMELKQEGEAADGFTLLMSREGERWPLLASCQLWLLRMNQRKFDQGMNVFNLLKTRPDIKQVLKTVPTNIRTRIRYLANIHIGVQSRFNRPNADRLDEIEQLLSIDQFFGISDRDTAMLRRELAIIYDQTGRQDEALSVAKDAALDWPNQWTVGEHVRLLVAAGRHNDALSELDRIAGLTQPISERDRISFQLTRARVLADAGQLTTARGVIIDSTALNSPLMNLQYDAFLLLGATYQLEEQYKKAKLAWANGANAVRSNESWQSDSHTVFVFHFLAGTSNTLTDQDCKDLLDAYLARLGNFKPLVSLLLSRSDAINTIRQMFSTKDGHKTAIDYALNRSNRELLANQFAATGFATHIETCIQGGEVSSRQRELLLQFASKFIEAFFAPDKLTYVQVGAVASSVIGLPTANAIIADLDPEIVAPILYINSVRARHRGDQEETKRLLQESLKIAVAGSLSEELAKHDLELIEANQGTLAVILNSPNPATMTISQNGRTIDEQQVSSESSIETLLKAGEYEVAVKSSDDDLTLSKTKFTISPASHAHVVLSNVQDAAASNALRQVTVTASPAGARIYCDNVCIGLATGKEQTFVVPLGEQTLRFDGEHGKSLVRVVPQQTAQFDLGVVSLVDDKTSSESLSGYALSFDGKRSHVVIPDMEDHFTKPWTVEFWATLPEDHQPVHTPFASPNITIQAVESKNPDHGGRWRVGMMVPEARYDGYEFPLGDLWQEKKRTHVAAQFDGKAVSLYINGVFTASRETPKGLIAKTGSWHLGQWGKNGHRLRGTIDELRVSSTTRYLKNFEPHNTFKNDELTVALYHFNQGSGNKLVDASGNNHHGVIQGAEWVSVDGKPLPPKVADTKPPTPADQVNGYALSFTGEWTQVIMPSLEPDLSKPWTVEAWVTVRNWATEQAYPNLENTVIACRDLAIHTRTIELDNHPGVWHATLELGQRSQSKVEHLYGDRWEKGRRRHVVLQFNGQSISMFINGRRMAVIDAPEGISAAVGYWHLGAWRGRQAWLDGLIDEVRISATDRYKADFEPADEFENDDLTVALYHFNEGYGDTLIDSSGNGHDGMIQGATWATPTGEPVRASVANKAATDAIALAARPPLPGLIAAPRLLDGKRRWQLIERVPRRSRNTLRKLLSASPKTNLLTITSGQWLLFYEIPSFRLARAIPSRLPTPTRIAWSKDGSKFATYQNHDIEVFDAKSGKRITRWRDTSHAPSDKWIDSLCWSPAGDRIATSHHWSERAITIWSLDGKILKQFDHSGSNDDISWSPDGKLLACASDPNVTVWQTNDWKEVWRVGRLRKEDGWAAWRAVDWNHDSSLLAIGGVGDGEQRVFFVDRKDWTLTPSTIKDYSHGNDVTWSSDSTLLAIASQDASSCIVQIGPDEERLVSRWRHRTGDKYPAAQSIVWTPDQKWVISTGDDLQLWLYTVEAKKIEKTVPFSQVEQETVDAQLKLTFGDGSTAILDQYGDLVEGDIDVLSKHLVAVVEDEQGVISLVDPKDVMSSASR